MELFSSKDLVNILRISHPEILLEERAVSLVASDINLFAVRLVEELRTYRAESAPKVFIDMTSVTKRVEALNLRLFDRDYRRDDLSESFICRLLEDFDEGLRPSLAALSRELGNGDSSVGLRQIITMMRDLDRVRDAAETVAERHHRPKVTDFSRGGGGSYSRFPTANWVGIGAIKSLSKNLHVALGFSRGTETSGRRGRPSGPMVRFVQGLFDHLRRVLAADSELAIVAKHAALAPTDYAIEKWIKAARNDRSAVADPGPP